MRKLRKGDSMVCVPCGREVVVSSAGVSGTTIWCCGVPMKGRAARKTRAPKKRKSPRS
ncbi:MAG: hypothetical protein PHN82_05340 [bacterium]|nr:hypothetical protein [bacterium]